MSRSDVDIKFAMDATAAIEAIRSVVRDLSLTKISMALQIAYHNGYQPVRILIGSRLAHRLGGVSIQKVYDVPVVVDASVVDGFGLVVQSPIRDNERPQDGGANDH